jgi:hypothetical protein
MQIHVCGVCAACLNCHDAHGVIEHQPLVIRILSWNGNVSLLFDFIYYLHSPKTKGQQTPTQTKILCLIFIQMCNINNYVNLNYKLVNREFGRTNTYIFTTLITHSKVYINHHSRQDNQ